MIVSQYRGLLLKLQILCLLDVLRSQFDPFDSNNAQQLYVKPQIIGVTAMCSIQGITAQLMFDGPFNGKIYSERYPTTHDCVYYNSYDISMILYSIPNYKCGTRITKDQRNIIQLIENEVYVQFDKETQTTDDRRFLFICENTGGGSFGGGGGGSIFGGGNGGSSNFGGNIGGGSSNFGGNIGGGSSNFGGNLGGGNSNFGESGNSLGGLGEGNNFGQGGSSNFGRNTGSENSQGGNTNFGATGSGSENNFGGSGGGGSNNFGGGTIQGGSSFGGSGGRGTFGGNTGAGGSGGLFPPINTNNFRPPFEGGGNVPPSGGNGFPVGPNFSGTIRPDQTIIVQTVEARRLIADGGTLNGIIPQPAVYMQIQDGEGPSNPPVDRTLQLGETITLVVGGRLNNAVGTRVDMQVHSCYAADGGGTNRVQIIDERGCSSRPSVTEALQKRRETEQIVYYTVMKAFKFPTSEDVYFTCSVDTCGDCNFPAPCSNLPFGRRRRNLNSSISDDSEFEDDSIPEDLEKFELSESVRIEELVKSMTDQAARTSSKRLSSEGGFCFGDTGFALLVTSIALLLSLFIGLSIRQFFWKDRKKLASKSFRAPPNPSSNLYFTNSSILSHSAGHFDTLSNSSSRSDSASGEKRGIRKGVGGNIHDFGSSGSRFLPPKS